VTIVAKATPEDWEADPTYTSPKAGANWQSFADDADLRQQSEYIMHGIPRIRRVGCVMMGCMHGLGDELR
jgi:hypothetical protein